MNEELIFAEAHSKVCNKKRPGRGLRSGRLQCGRKLYQYPLKIGEPLDIFYNKKKHSNPAHPLEADKQ